MSDMPEKIFAAKNTSGLQIFPATGKCIVSFTTPSEEYHIEYCRADLPITLEQALKLPEIKALVEALKGILEALEWTEMKRMPSEYLAESALAALAAK